MTNENKPAGKPKDSTKSTAERVFDLAIGILEKWEKGSPFDDIMDDDLVASGLRRTVSDIFFSYFRNKAGIDFVIDSHTKNVKPKMRRILSVAMTQMHFQTGIPPQIAADVAVSYASARFGKTQGGFINAVLRKTGAKSFKDHLYGVPANVASGLPELLHRRWSAEFGAEVAGRLSSLLKEKCELTFRLSGGAGPEVLKDMACEPVELPFLGPRIKFFVAANAKSLFDSGLLDSGSIYIQDPAAAAAPLLLDPKPGEDILDMCAAPGGKSLMMADLERNVRLTAADRSESRQKKTASNFKRAGLNATVVTADAASASFAANSFDAILLDVPCTNTGVFRHKPDALWRFSEGKLKELVALQSVILENSVRYLKPGGRIVYSTCSIENAENAGQVDAFLSKHPEFSKTGEVLLMPCRSNDGAYAVCLRRNS